MSHSITSTIQNYTDAFRFFIKYPKLYFKALIPIILSALIIFTIVITIVILFILLMGSLLYSFESLGFWIPIIHTTSIIIFIIIMFFFSYLLFTSITLIIGDKFYEKLWIEVETSILGEDSANKLQNQLSIIQQLKEDSKTIFMSIKVAVKVTLLVLLFSLIPIIGSVLAFIFGLFYTGLIATEDYTRRALHGRNYLLESRLQFLKSYKKEAYSFGIVSQLLFMIPFIGIFLMPITVVASTFFVHSILDSENEIKDIQ